MPVRALLGRRREKTGKIFVFAGANLNTRKGEKKGKKRRKRKEKKGKKKEKGFSFVIQGKSELV